MAASALSSQTHAATGGLRRVRLRQDLSAIADLIEIAFEATMDSGGRAAVQDMRALGRMGPFLWPMMWLDPNIRALNQGFVWIDPSTQKLIGNVSLYGTGYDSSLVVANVATHPDFRRQGIATALMEATLNYAEKTLAEAVILQVEADNWGARQLYEQLGFQEQRAFIRWRRSSYLDAPARLATMPPITLRKGREWKAELALATQVRPNDLGGVGWLLPTTPRSFHKSLRGQLTNFWGGPQRWIIRDPEDESQLLASMRIESPFATRYSRAHLMIAPGHEYGLSKAMINFALRTLEASNRGLIVEHPADDEDANAVFEEYQFEVSRHLVHMQWLLGA